MKQEPLTHSEHPIVLCIVMFRFTGLPFGGWIIQFCRTADETRCKFVKPNAVSQNRGESYVVVHKHLDFQVNCLVSAMQQLLYWILSSTLP